MMTFQVKNNGKSLTLSPLFANLSTDENVMKALDMAGIPVTDRTVAMTESMMREGMSIDKQSLQTMLKFVNAFPEAAPEQMVQLQKLSIPITQTNLEQAENYQALTHQIEKGLGALTEELAAVIDAGYGQGKATETNRLLEAVVKAVFKEAAPENGSGSQQEGLTAGKIEKEGVTAGKIVKEGLTAYAEDVLFVGENEPAMSLDGGKLKAQNLLSQLQNLLEEGTDSQQLSQKVFCQLGRELVSVLKQELQEQFSLSPDKVREAKPVQELYERIQRQLSGLEEAVSRTIGKENTLMKGVNQMQQNLDFMHQLNQAFSFVQLPLKMNERSAHGDLYVYTNKKNLAQKEGSVSAFLHLDMEQLGSVDIYVTMEEQKVGTRFFVRDDEMLSFLYSHMHILDERLQKRGYTFSCEMKVMEEGTKAGVLDTILSKERAVSLLSQHAFDVRA